VVKSTILGYPRIGANRELKKALEAYWSGKSDASALDKAAAELRINRLHTIKESGVDYIPSGDFALYDHVLDMAFALGAVPSRYIAAAKNPLDRYFAAARGTQAVPAMEMTKWMNTNYHYIVPEFGNGQTFKANSQHYVAQYQEAKALGIETRPVLVGPVSFLLLGKTHNDVAPISLLDDLLPAYKELLADLEKAGAQWVQLDEPYLATDLSAEIKSAYQQAYKSLRASTQLKIFVASYFGEWADNADVALSLPIDAVHIDLTQTQNISEWLEKAPQNLTLSLGLVNGRNIWRTDLDSALAQVKAAISKIGSDRVWVSSSCSLLHSPHDLTLETKLGADVLSRMAFARQKLDEVSALCTAANGDEAGVSSHFTESRNALKAPRSTNASVRAELAKVDASFLNRKRPYSERKKVQAAKFNLPLYPTTTIGSFPQTEDVRKSRADFKAGSLSASEYQKFLEQKTVEVLHIQEELGIDVLVHGEFERNDMVEYFGEQLQGFVFTQHGWVQSYGSRCVKPPVIEGDVARKSPMTVEWSKFAQSNSKLPVKGMLTGPVTILQWSFVRDDQPRSETCKQIALALRAEVADLESAGIGMIQIDEPAIREGLPLRRSQWNDYLRWAVDSFRLSSCGVRDETQIHTHMCYSDFEDIMQSIDDLDADVLSIETSRSQMELLECFKKFSYSNAIGPGVYDIHSPRVPEQKEIIHLLTEASKYLPIDAIWVNPDCGLKTRAWPETKAALKIMVDAAKAMRAEKLRQSA